jgi:hypothetical protein
MIRHFLFFKIKTTVSQEVIDQAFNMLFSLKNKIPGLLRITGGVCRFHEGKGKGTITHGFSIDFVDEEAYQVFLNDPITMPAKNCILNITVDGMQGIYGFDIGEFFPGSSQRKYRIQAPRLRLLPPGAMY